MIIYSSEKAAIAQLKQRGYTDEFYLFETKLLWMQKKIFISKEEFQIDDSIYFQLGNRKGRNRIVFGITLKNSGAKGILLNDFIKYAAAIPIIIRSKLHEKMPVTNHS